MLKKYLCLVAIIDPVVPCSHAVRLHEALKKAGVINELITIPGGKHGGFNHEQTVRAFTAIREFLARQGLMKADQTATAPR